eukprot:TRINITY_DN81919_c0_g1_i1.p1 TRINITY_DN81919_c0_g1~~TRINITY_DN81919_c0_g1_i1.p1  ORF type:complete len:110 (+),score=28.39 TRINITY_DN81919_c0_g1_i1:41-370(+)
MGKKIEKKTKEQIAKAAASSSRGKKKKWSKGKTKEKADNAVFFTPEIHTRLIEEVPNGKVITVSHVSDKLKVNGSVARAGIRELCEKGLIKPVHTHHRQLIYTRIEKEQ